MKKVMILGAGRGQIPLIELCHKHGAYVIAVSPKGDYPGFKMSDEVFYEDIKNKDSILEKAKELSIDAILTDQLDQSVPTVAYVAENMGLPGIGYDTALKFTDKYIMRRAAASLGINVPESRLLKNIGDAKAFINNGELQFPLIMKPVDGSASNGIFRIDSIEEIEKHFLCSQNYSKTKNVILERFIDGDEYVVEAYTHNYEVRNLMVGHRDYFKIPGTFIPCATVFQDAQHAESPLEKQLLKENEVIVKGFHLKFGITHAEYIVEKETGKIYLVEIAARGGGVFISSEIIPAASGVNANELLVKDSLGIYDEVISVKKGAAAYFCYLLSEGIISKIEGCNQVLNEPGVRTAFFDNIEQGSYVGPIRDKASRKGPIIVFGAAKEECYDVMKRVKKHLIIQTIQGGIVQDAIW